MSKRPLIGVTGPSAGGSAAWLLASLAIVRAGGIPRHITQKTRESSWRNRLNGLVVGGGADIHPDLYGGPVAVLGDVLRATSENARGSNVEPSARLLAPAVFLLRYLLRAKQPTSRFDHTRDSHELGVLADAVARDLPILGICRGAQLLNVYFGGTLYAEVRDFYADAPLRTVFPRRKVEVEPGSRLASIVGGTSFRVNALHHQAVSAVGRGLRAVARDDGGVIQAIEQSDHPFRIGVQWHPEFIPQHERQVSLFKALVDAARR